MKSKEEILKKNINSDKMGERFDEWINYEFAKDILAAMEEYASQPCEKSVVENPEYYNQLSKNFGKTQPYHFKGEKCVSGCKRFTAYETKHHPDCPFYPNSLSEQYDKISQPCEGREVYRTEYAICPKCNGNGHVPSSGITTSVFETCNYCNGSKSAISATVSRTTLPVALKIPKEHAIDLLEGAEPNLKEYLSDARIWKICQWIDSYLDKYTAQFASPLLPIAEEKVSEGEAVTEQQWCKLHTGYYGEEIDRVEQLVQTRMTGRELFEYCQHIVRHFKALSSLPPASIEQEKWVRVEDGLPEFGEKVLVLGEARGMNPQMGGAYIFICVRKNLKGTSIEKQQDRYVDSNQFVAQYVTHWQPLPTPPIEQR